MDKAPFFSIIVPCCEVESYVEECILSVLRQSFQDWECLIGIETSKDRTEKIIREKTVGDPRFRIFTGPRTGSCSVSRNKGIDMATGEYIIFLDGDDLISDGCLERLYKKISENPGADLYPCAIFFKNEIKEENKLAFLKARNRKDLLVDCLRDNYGTDVPTEMSGVEAIIHAKEYNPMLQTTIHRRQFLLDHNLKCIEGLRYQDHEFTARAYYLAKRVIPLHETVYNYRIHSNSVQTFAKNENEYLKDWAVIIKSMLQFHEKISRENDFDVRITKIWQKRFFFPLVCRFFSLRCQKEVPREKRVEYLNYIFEDNFDAFDCLMTSASFHLSIAAFFVRMFVKHEHLRWIADLFFRISFLPFYFIRSYQWRRCAKNRNKLKAN